MLLHEIFSLFGSLDDYLLMEGFKDDMFKQYPEDVENKDFKAAIASYNSDPKLKEALKHAIKPQGNIAVSIKRQCPTGADFVKLINSLIKNAKDKQEYKQLKQGTVSAGETDYWMIPCHTFKELHEAAFKYIGNLPRLSNDEIESKYNVAVPEEATHYETSDSPAEFLEKMKKETRFFMAPSWCVAANKDYFDDYELETSKNEQPLCYVFISKKYPNVRFCVTLKKESEKTNDNSYDNGEIKIRIINKVSLDEARDPWQIGGEDVTGTGLEMMELAFGLKMRKVIDDMCSEETTIETVPSSELVNGESLFAKNYDISDISCSFDSLKIGYKMFFNSGLKNIDCKFPLLYDGERMFSDCLKLTSINNDFPNLKNGMVMFCDCKSLSEVNTDLSKLAMGNLMFSNCTKLKKFECKKLPYLERGSRMFSNCQLLEEFNYDLPNLDIAHEMFLGCKNLKKFNSSLPKLTNGEKMFSNCGKLEFRSQLPSLFFAEDMFKDTQLDMEGVKIIIESLPKPEYPHQCTIHLGIRPEGEDVDSYIKIAKNKNWIVIFQ